MTDSTRFIPSTIKPLRIEALFPVGTRIWPIKFICDLSWLDYGGPYHLNKSFMATCIFDLPGRRELIEFNRVNDQVLSNRYVFVQFDSPRFDPSKSIYIQGFIVNCEHAHMVALTP